MAAETVRDIVDFGIGMPPGWYPMPLEAAADLAWGIALASTLTEHDTMRARLADELELARSRFREIGDPALTAAVWIPFPQIGRTGAALAFSLAPLEDVGDPDGCEAALADPVVGAEESYRYFAVQTWRARIAAGEVVGSHNLIAHPMEDGGAELEERVVAVVFPPGAAQAVQFVASAENLGVFTDMVQDVQDLVATLAVTLGEPE